MNRDSILAHLEPEKLEQQLHQIPRFLRVSMISKIAIALLVVCMIAAVILLPFLQPEDEGVRIAFNQDELTLGEGEKPVMKNPRFESVDGSDQPFTVRANQAIQEDESRVTLLKVSGDISLNSGLWLALQAETGEMNIEQQHLILKDKVQVFASNGYELRANDTTIDMKKNQAYSQSGVQGQGPMGTIKADEYRIDGKENVLNFNKNVKLVIYP